MKKNEFIDNWQTILDMPKHLVEALERDVDSLLSQAIKDERERISKEFWKESAKLIDFHRNDKDERAAQGVVDCRILFSRIQSLLNPEEKEERTTGINKKLINGALSEAKDLIKWCWDNLESPDSLFETWSNCTHNIDNLIDEAIVNLDDSEQVKQEEDKPQERVTYDSTTETFELPRDSSTVISDPLQEKKGEEYGFDQENLPEL